jgi:hypothetical protein
MANHIGVQYTAPNGLAAMERGTIYFLVSNRGGRVLLAYFWETRLQRRVSLIAIPRSKFEQALDEKSIVRCEVQATLPSWVGSPATFSEQCRVEAEARANIVKPLLKEAKVILLAADPIREISGRAHRSKKPKLHPHRLALWFFLFLVFGRNKWALVRPRTRVGRWARTEGKHRGKKFGRLSRSGRRHGYPVDAAMKDQIWASYEKLSALGVPMAEIYATAMVKYFDCRVDKGGKHKQYFHPSGEPYPNFYQYRYHVIQKYGLRRVQIRKYGETRVRNKIASFIGSFTEDLANLMERVETDAYHTIDHPRSIIHPDEIMPHLCVVRGQCSTSGLDIGIGFAHENETGEAYRMMLFCAAVSKVYFCRLFGIEITEDQWPSMGLPLELVPDRGPGASEKVLDGMPEHLKFTVHITPTRDPQSHGLIESTHPRKIKILGRPTYLVSDLNIFQMAQREIYALLNENKGGRSAKSRLTNEMRAAGIDESNLGVWNYMDANLRTNALPMSIDDAVRAFLIPVEFTVVKGLLTLDGTRFTSSSLRESELVARAEDAKISGFVLPMCFRYAWVEINNQIMEVEAVLPIRDDKAQLNITHREAKHLAQMSKDDDVDYQQHRLACKSETILEYAAATGKQYNLRKRKNGRAKAKTKETADERRYLAARHKRGRR